MGDMQQLFSTKLTLKVTGATRRNLDNWVTEGVLVPTQAGRPRQGHRWSFRDLVQIRTIVELRQAGISLVSLRRVAVFLREYGGDFASTFLVVAGGDVFIAHDDQLISALKQPGQFAMVVYDLEHSENAVRQALAMTPTHDDMMVVAS
jgi:MerR HTH family regulatory protein